MNRAPSRTRVYFVWRNMVSRCTRPNHPLFEHYGARGITVAPAWLSFSGFIGDMGGTYREGLTLERRDNDGPYDKDNCVWADRHTQQRNRRSNVWVATPAGRMVITDAAAYYGLSVRGVKYRMRKGIPLDIDKREYKRSSSRYVDTPLGRMTLTQAAATFNLNYDCLRYRADTGLAGAALVRPSGDAV